MQSLPKQSTGRPPVIPPQKVIQARNQVRAGTATAAQLARDWGFSANVVRHAVSGVTHSHLNQVCPPVISAPGERSRRALTPDAVVDARSQVRQRKATVADLAAEADVPYNTMWHAVSGASWTTVNHIEPPVAPAPASGQSPEGTPRLTARKVASARRRYLKGVSFAALAANYGVAQSTIMAAVHGRTWRHVQNPPPVPPGTAGRAHLTPAQVNQIRVLSGQMTAQEIATQTGISKSTVSRILNGHRRGTALTR